MGKKSEFNLKQIMSARSMHQEKRQIDGQVTLQDWIEWKEDIKNRVQAIYEDYIAIGYRLKQIRDSRAYERDGYRSLTEFAWEEYRFSKSTVYRLCQVNDAFSVDGNSMEIQERYRGYGLSKLQEMLALTPEERTCITQDMTVREIREIRGDREQGPNGEEKEPEEPREAAGAETGNPLDNESESQEEPQEPQEEAGQEVDDKQEKVATSRQNEGWKEPKPEPSPHELPPSDAVYREKIGATMLSEITEGSRRYLIIKMRHRYREGNTVILQEHRGGKPTGKTVEIQVAHMTEESGGLLPGYCILGFFEWKEGYEEIEDED